MDYYRRVLRSYYNLRSRRKRRCPIRWVKWVTIHTTVFNPHNPPATINTPNKGTNTVKQEAMPKAPPRKSMSRMRAPAGVFFLETNWAPHKTQIYWWAQKNKSAGGQGIIFKDPRDARQ